MNDFDRQSKTPPKTLTRAIFLIKRVIVHVIYLIQFIANAIIASKQESLVLYYITYFIHLQKRVTDLRIL